MGIEQVPGLLSRRCLATNIAVQAFRSALTKRVAVPFFPDDSGSLPKQRYYANLSYETRFSTEARFGMKPGGKL